jgi:hypothetical protein
MKKCSLLLLIFFLAASVAAEDQEPYRPRYYPRPDLVSEKRFEAVVTPDDPNPFWLNTTTGDLWKLDPEQMVWVYLGDPRGASGSSKGTYRLLPYQPGEVIVLNTSTGEAWWTDGKLWIEIEEPSTRVRRSE